MASRIPAFVLSQLSEKFNGSETSNKANREVAVQFASPTGYTYLREVFEHDWALGHGPMVYRVYLPLVLRDYVPPADYPLITEVFINPGGEDAGEGAGRAALERVRPQAHRLPVDHAAHTPFVIVGSRSHATPELHAYVEEMRRERGDVRFVSAGSSLKYCLVAEGRADVYPRLGPTMEWDTAAGQVIAGAAGARVVRRDTDEPLRYNKEDLLNPWHIVTRRMA